MKAPSGEQWVHEVKHDGFRLMAWSRSANGTLERIPFELNRDALWILAWSHVLFGKPVPSFPGHAPKAPSNYHALEAVMRIVPLPRLSVLVDPASQLVKK